MGEKTLGLYIHIPFCVKKCGYCDFCSVTDFSLIPGYVERVCDDIRAAGRSCGGLTVDTVYFGGGTPTCAGEALNGILTAVRGSFCLAEDAEITVEANPATADLPLLTSLRRGGFNRLSVGVQSANDNELARLGRVHSFEDAVRTVLSARAAGFEDIGGDMMLGIPEQTAESMLYTVGALASLGMTHISAYMLKIEPDTPFGKAPPADLPDDEKVAELYLTALKCMEGFGYRRYEISNFAKPGYECRHNIKYWTLGDYIGFGPTAHSCFGGRRTSTEGSVAEYVAGRAKKADRGVCGDFSEYLMLAMRTLDGVSISESAGKYGRRFVPNAVTSALEKNGLITVGDRISLTDTGVLVSNSIITELDAAFVRA